MIRDSSISDAGVNRNPGDLLEAIFAHKREEVAARKQASPLHQVRAAAEAAEKPLDFVAALYRAPFQPALIAEIKRASPSRGLLTSSLDPQALAQTYVAAGAAAISVLTDERFFAGSLDDLRAVARLHTGAPLLRKDFICDPYQVYEARAAGADAILLIAAYLDDALLCELHQLAQQLGMAALVEVHNEDDLGRALACQPRLIGINNRDLRTFVVSLEVTHRLAPQIPASIAVVAESGIFTPHHVTALAGLERADGGPAIQAILVGEALVTAPDTAALTRVLASAGAPRSPIPDRRSSTGP